MDVIQKLGIIVLVPVVASIPVIVVILAPLNSHLLVEQLLLLRRKTVVVSSSPISSHLSSLLVPIMSVPVPAIVVAVVPADSVRFVASPIARGAIPVTIAVPVIIIPVTIAVPVMIIAMLCIRILADLPVIVIGKGRRCRNAQQGQT